VVLYAALDGWDASDLVTPACLGGRIDLLAYGRSMRSDSGPASFAARPDARATSGADHMGAVRGTGRQQRIRETATLAQWSGRGRAVTQSEHFADLPRVILDTTDERDAKNGYVVTNRLGHNAPAVGTG
jgi:hypothetical protein